MLVSFIWQFIKPTLTFLIILEEIFVIILKRKIANHFLGFQINVEPIDSLKHVTDRLVNLFNTEH